MIMKKTIINRKSNFNATSLRRGSTMALKFFFTFAMLSFLSGCDFMDHMDEIKKDKKHEEEAKLFVAELHPLNNSGVSGKATFKYKRDSDFLAQVHAKGLVPDMLHPQRIHGFDESSRDATCPPEDAAGDDGLLSLEDGLPFYGPVLVPLDDELVPLSIENFPTANAAGRISYSQSTTLQRLITALDELLPGQQSAGNLNLQNRTVVLHGAFVKDNQIVPPGTEGAEYDATIPVACGEIKEAGGGHGDGGQEGGDDHNHGGGGNGDDDHGDGDDHDHDD
jgi:hypothetical protein